MKFNIQNAIDDVRQLTNRIRAREVLADELCQKIHSVQAQLISMRQYQEEIVSFDELANKLGNRPKSPLMLCLAAENKQLQQLKVENHALINSLEEHRTVMDIIMAKYREQVSQLLHTNKVESIVRSESRASPQFPRIRGPQAAKQTATAPPGSSTSDDKSAQQLASQVAKLAAIARDVSDKGDAYATELEKELFRLRAENTGLRELLEISHNFSVQSSADSSGGVESSDQFTSQRKSSVMLDKNQHCDVMNTALPNPPSASSRKQPFMSVRKHMEEGHKDDYDRVYSMLLCSQTEDGGVSGQEDDGLTRDFKDVIADDDALTVTDSGPDDIMFEPVPYMRSFHSLG